MQQFHLYSFVNAWINFASFDQWLTTSLRSGGHIRLTEKAMADFSQTLEQLEQGCSFLCMNAARKKIADIKKHWMEPGGWRELKMEFIQLFDIIADDLTQPLLMFIQPEKAAYYDAQKIFGPTVTKKFPKCSTDIEEAGKCFAAGRSTAAVFHLMRLTEYGVRRLAGKLKLTVKPNATWGQILTAMDPAIGALPTATERQRKRQHEYQELRASLHAVKEAWRNPTMHPQATYTNEAAQEIFQHVKAFMRRLAELV